jgi:hypothetical protein
MNRRNFLRWTGKGLLFSALGPLVSKLQAETSLPNDLFWVKNIPDHPFSEEMGLNAHVGVECLLHLMGKKGLRFYRSEQQPRLSGPLGMIGSEDVVLIKVNAQWKYRGCTNSDLVRGLIQRILDHPDGFTGEVVIVENGQGRGSLDCDTQSAYADNEVHANAEDETHSFMYLVDHVFNDPRVSAYLLDPIRTTFIGSSDHVTDGYRIFENVSYPCFTTSGGQRVELREGIWNGSGYDDNLKLINFPVLKHHDIGGSEITGALKNFYGIVSMQDGQVGFRHYAGLGETCGKMIASVRTPVLNILDAIWVSHSSLTGYPASTTFRANQILASQDPVALDYWAAKHVMYPIDANFRHHPDFPGIDYWLTEARDIINQRGGLYNLQQGLFIENATKNEQEMLIHEYSAQRYIQGAVDQRYKRNRGKRHHVIK